MAIMKLKNSMEIILVVEDEKEVRNNIIELLTYEGYDCIEAKDGLEAINHIKKTLPDLVLSDVLMPNISGFELYKFVQSMDLKKNLPFIFLTALADEESLSYGMKLGADDYITKPYKAGELLERIKVRLMKQKSIDEKFDNLKTGISLYVPHELSTPLISILGYTELLINDLENLTPTEVKEMLNSIHNSGLRLNNRVEKFISYTENKLDNKNSDEKVVVDIGKYDFINKIESCFECKKRIDDIIINVENCSINISDHDFEVILREIIENACKYSALNSTITISGSCENNKYIFSVENTGNEISTDNISEFSLENDNYNQDYNGLGLSIVQMIAKKYNVKMKIDSKESVKVSLIFPISDTN
jgi:DNA-binding response OmpR family regulator/two-component sensor histidine kinase